MHVMSKESVLNAAKKAFAQEFVIGNAESHPREFAHWVAVQQSRGLWWTVSNGEHHV